MWFWFSVITLLCWSGSDLFSKIGCREKSQKYSHLKMVMTVGLVMGVHAAIEIFLQGVEISFSVILTYLPVSLLYILSMTVGYLGLRYIELSISSPICNSSGALVAILTFCIFGFGSLEKWQLIGVAIVCFGVVALGIVEMTEDEELRLERQKLSNMKYAKSVWALLLPVIYCLLDALGTFADSLVLTKLDENSANVAYELTFFFVGILCAFYVLICKKDRLIPKLEAPKLIGACFETAGQLAYIYALSDTEYVALSAPIISAYCVASVLWSRIFLKEKLSFKHYLAIFVTVAGLIILGIYDI